MNIDETTEAPGIDRVEHDADTGATIRLRANSKYTQKEGWHGESITVEFTGPVTTNTHRMFSDRTTDLHLEIAEACKAMNAVEGRG